MEEHFIKGEKNLITDVEGIYVGNSESKKVKTGTTVIIGDSPLTAGVHIMGGAPGTRDTELLTPDKIIQKIDAIVLSGGSAFGLEAASGVSESLAKLGRGFPSGQMRIPIVPSAIIFDLNNGGEKNWKKNPYRKLGKQALKNATSQFKLGSYGAGVGATTLNLKGGLGSASVDLPGGVTVGALVAVNSVGSTTLPDNKNFLAAPYELAGEFGNLQPLEKGLNSCVGWDKIKVFSKQATTIAVVATNANIDKSQATRMAIAAHDGIARAVIPSHTPFDGDLIFAISTNKKNLSDPVFDTLKIGHAAAQCLTRSIARAVFFASSHASDLVPAWSKINKLDG